MTHSARPVLGTVVAAVALVALIVACGSSATPAPASQAAPTPPSGASVAPGSTDDGLGGLLGSFGLGSLGLGNLLHGAPDLEAVLPATMCGAPTLKFSMGGASILGAAAGQIPAMYGSFIAATGKTMADVEFASASSTGTGDCPDITAFKVNGLDQNSLQGFYTTMETSDNNSPTQATIGGKAVIKTTDGSYAYFKNDTVFIIDTDSDDTAAAALQLLP